MTALTAFDVVSCAVDFRICQYKVTTLLATLPVLVPRSYLPTLNKYASGTTLPMCTESMYVLSTWLLVVICTYYYCALAPQAI